MQELKQERESLKTALDEAAKVLENSQRLYQDAVLAGQKAEKALEDLQKTHQQSLELLETEIADLKSYRIKYQEELAKIRVLSSELSQLK